MIDSCEKYLSIDKMIRLKNEFGLDIEDSSHSWREENFYDGDREWSEFRISAEPGFMCYGNDCPCYDADDLLRKVPKKIDDYKFILRSDAGDNWFVGYYKEPEMLMICFRGDEIVNVLYDLVIWLLKNNIPLVNKSENLKGLLWKHGNLLVSKNNGIGVIVNEHFALCNGGYIDKWGLSSDLKDTVGNGCNDITEVYDGSELYHNGQNFGNIWNVEDVKRCCKCIWRRE